MSHFEWDHVRSSHWNNIMSTRVNCLQFLSIEVASVYSNSFESFQMSTRSIFLIWTKSSQFELLSALFNESLFYHQSYSFGPLPMCSRSFVPVRIKSSQLDLTVVSFSRLKVFRSNSVYLSYFERVHVRSSSFKSNQVRVDY